VSNWSLQYARATHKHQERSGVIGPAVIGLILPLALDTFAVSAAVGLTNPTRRDRLRLSGVFALFEGGAPAIGILVGGPLGAALGAIADYLAIAILIGFGAFILLRSEDGENERASRMVSARGPALILIGLSVSLDELAIGFSLGLLGVPVLPFLAAIAAQAFAASQLGFRLGASLSERLFENAERLAGIALIALGAILLAERLL
jgi:putative Mn2+ efflux pump MntP